MKCRSEVLVATSRRHSSQRRSRRRAMFVAAVLVCLSIVTVVTGSWMKQISSERQQIHHQANILQAAALAEAGLARATAYLTQDNTYRGETWQIAPDELSQTTRGEVQINVTLSDENPQARHVTIVADFPAADTKRVRRSIQQTIYLPRQEP